RARGMHEPRGDPRACAGAWRGRRERRSGRQDARRVGSVLADTARPGHRRAVPRARAASGAAEPVNSSTPASALEGLGRQNPEWRPWLDLLAAARGEMASRAWDEAVPATPSSPADTPILDGAELTLERSVADRWVRHLLTTVARHGGPSASLAEVARAS